MMKNLRIERRFRGPPAGGNGGYVAGLVARELGSSGCMVTLKAPPPLEQDLQLKRSGKTVALWAGERLIAEAAPAAVQIDVPPPPPVAAAADAQARFSGFASHVFPGCFVCGPERAAGDGLRIFAGPLGDDRAVASSWSPDASLADASGIVEPEFIWAALDCPGYFAVEPDSGPAVLGRMGAILHRPVFVGVALTVSGWPIASDGRKFTVGTAIHDAESHLIAAAKATWIAIEARDWQE